MSDVAVPEYTIKVFCDDECHARRKVAKVESFRLIAGLWAPGRQDLKNTYMPVEPDGSYRRPIRYRHPCNLCESSGDGQAPWECTEDTRQGLLNWVFRNRVKLTDTGVLKTDTVQCVSRISLKRLHL